METTYAAPEFWALSDAAQATEELADDVMFYIYPSMEICPANVFPKSCRWRHPMPTDAEAHAVWDERVRLRRPLTREEALDVLAGVHLAQALAS
jgi:hypothetical protein